LQLLPLVAEGDFWLLLADLGGTMIALVVTINIKPEHKKAFMESMLDDARGSNQDEPGCLRFDVLQDSEDPNRIHLYEVYRDQAAWDAHRRAPHYLKWRETVKDWFATENVRRVAAPVYPPEGAWRKR
jgi:quinol monooxygenase YgiN